jgi:putative oxidoreductase
MTMSNSSKSPVALLGRILISAIFILGGANFFASFHSMEGLVRGAGIPLPAFSTACAAVLEFFGGLAILAGFRTRLAAWLLFLFLIPTTLLFHNFWAVQGAQRIDQLVNFQKNLAIMGGLLVLAAFGSGPYSIDNRNEPGA